MAITGNTNINLADKSNFVIKNNFVFFFQILIFLGSTWATFSIAKNLISETLSKKEVCGNFRISNLYSVIGPSRYGGGIYSVTLENVKTSESQQFSTTTPIDLNFRSEFDNNPSEKFIVNACYIAPTTYSDGILKSMVYNGNSIFYFKTSYDFIYIFSCLLLFIFSLYTLFCTIRSRLFKKK